MNSSAISPGAFLLALLLHAAVAASFMFALEFNRPQVIRPPLTIKATLTQVPDVVRAPVEQAPPDPAPEPVREEPEPPPPEPTVDERRLLEQQKLEQERLLEEQRLEELRKRQEEERRQQALEEQRRREEAERKRREEEELERKRAEAELERQREIERQRAKNREEEALALASAIAAEEALNEARNSDAMTAYLFALQQKVVRNWSPPPSAQSGLDCQVRVRQTSTGQVISARVLTCNGDAAVERSILAAVEKAAPLPMPENSLLFEPEITFVFRPND